MFFSIQNTIRFFKIRTLCQHFSFCKARVHCSGLQTRLKYYVVYAWKWLQSTSIKRLIMPSLTACTAWICKTWGTAWARYEWVFSPWLLLRSCSVLVSKRLTFSVFPNFVWVCKLIFKKKKPTTIWLSDDKPYTV